MRMLEVLGQQSNLSAVVGVMRDLPVDGLHHRVGLSADCDGAAQVPFGQGLKRAEQSGPSLFP